MGQYHYLVNLDKFEYVHPHQLGDGLKLWEQAASCYGTCSAACILLAAPEARGGGDFDTDYPEAQEVVGRWHGDRVAWVGDYAEEYDLPEEDHAETIYARCDDDIPGVSYLRKPPEFRNITRLLKPVLEHEFHVKFEDEEHKVYNPNGELLRTFTTTDRRLAD